MVLTMVEMVFCADFSEEIRVFADWRTESTESGASESSFARSSQPPRVLLYRPFSVSCFEDGAQEDMQISLLIYLIYVYVHRYTNACMCI